MRTPNEKENMNKQIHMDYILECAKHNYELRSQWFLYIVTNGFYAVRTSGVYIKDNGVMHKNYKERDFIAYPIKFIKKDSIIEFRYEYDAHCRDIDDDYWRIDKSILALCCEPYAKIEENTGWENKLNLREILENKLYIEMDN